MNPYSGMIGRIQQQRTDLELVVFVLFLKKINKEDTLSVM